MLEPHEATDWNFDPIEVGEHRAFITRWLVRGAEYYSVHVQGRNASTGIEYTLLETDGLDDHPSEEDIAEMVADELEARFDRASS